MELAALIEALVDPAVYPGSVADVEVRQTHISVVFLTAQHVYKVKKPVNLGFVDFSTLALRRHFCEEEVRLNARLAAEVYMGVVSIVAADDGVRVEGPGEPIEWAVKMRRLPDDATLESRLARGAVTPELVAAVARRIAQFHAGAETNERIAAFGRFDMVAANVRGNFEQSSSHVGQTVRRQVMERLETLAQQALETNRAFIEARAARGMVRDTHGDLRLDHIYLVGDGNVEKMLIIDCIEFNEQFRFADPVADIAFLAMDLKFEGHAELAESLADAYFAATGDDEGRRLLPFYTSYRAAVRAKVEGFKQAEAEVPESERSESRVRAAAYWLLALGELERPEDRPCLVLVGGLPGSGKSTLAIDLSRHGEFHVIRSDEVRKRIARVAAEHRGGQDFGTGIYSDEWNDRTYAECLRRAEQLVIDGERVIVDASFREEARRRAFLDMAARWCVPAVFLECRADAETIHRRLDARQGDVSDADWAIYEQASGQWQPPSLKSAERWQVIDSGQARQHSLDEAQSALRRLGSAC